MFDKTIAALSTPFGRGAIAMIRLTGDHAVSVASAVFKPKNGRPLTEIPSNTAVYGDFIYGGSVIDDGIATVYRSPASYTGEDMAELCCHGGVLVSDVILRSLYESGAEPAQGGEFTRRAFINGKLHLSEAEAIMNIIDAESLGALRIAGGAGRGLLSAEAEKMYSELKHLIAAAYAYIDYPDEDMTDITVDQMKDALTSLIDRAEELKNSYKTAYAVCEGVKTVICGKPNVGKSSLLNMLSEKEVAIVTEIPGTTRDVVTNRVQCGQVLLRLADTAGLRETDDTVEQIGVERAKKELASAGLVLAVFDGAEKPDSALIEELKRLNVPVIAVINKSDIADGALYDGIFENTVHISAKNNEGRSELINIVEKLFIGGGIDYDKPHISNERQYAQISRFINSCRSAHGVLCSGQTQDIACFDLEDALSAIAELDGIEVTDDIVNEIFSKFCVGK